MVEYVPLFRRMQLLEDKTKHLALVEYFIKNDVYSLDSQTIEDLNTHAKYTRNDIEKIKLKITIEDNLSSDSINISPSGSRGNIAKI